MTGIVTMKIEQSQLKRIGIEIDFLRIEKPLAFHAAETAAELANKLIFIKEEGGLSASELENIQINKMARVRKLQEIHREYESRKERLMEDFTGIDEFELSKNTLVLFNRRANCLIIYNEESETEVL